MQTGNGSAAICELCYMPQFVVLPLFAICWTAPRAKHSRRLRCALYALGVALATITAFPLLT